MVLLSSIEFTKINILFSYIRIRKNVKWLQKVYLHIIFVYIGSLSIIYVRWKKNDGNYVQILSIVIDGKLYLQKNKFFETKREMKSSRYIIHLCQPNF